MAIVLNGTTGITAPDIDVTAQSTDIVTTGDVSAVDGTFSGGVYLGGTGAANYLDDYEEGTFTATLTVDSGTAPTTPPTVTGHYRKIGSVVWCSVQFDNADASGSGGGGLQITGLPFNASFTSGVGSPMTFRVPSVNTYNVFYIPSGETRIRLYEISNNAGWSTVSLPNQGQIYIWHSFAYATNQ